jgi:rhodanese-related sulfurtransferase
VALELRKVGHEAYALVGGYDAWRDAGLPVQPMDGSAHAPTP